MIKIIKLYLFFFILFIVASIFFFKSYDQFGLVPTRDMQAKWHELDNFNKINSEFKNRVPGLLDDMPHGSSFSESLIEWFSNTEGRRPSVLLPTVKFNKEDFLKQDSDFKIIWLGHSSLLLNLEGKMILVDPVFGPSAAPFSFIFTRFQKSSVSLMDLPKIDFVLITHDHYDHLDMSTIKFFLDSKVKFIVPLGIRSHLLSWGVKEKNIYEKNWWEEVKFKNLIFTCTPAQHFSGRNTIENNRTLWASWVIKTKKVNTYFSGDSGYDIHFKEIGERLGPFDIAFMENGQYDKNWRGVHMLPFETIQASIDLKTKKIFPIHWGMFELSFHSWKEPIVELLKEANKREIKKTSIMHPKLGKTFYFDRYNDQENWWENL